MIDLKDTVVVITGASSGIGKETAHLFAKENSRLLLTALEEEELERVVRDLEKLTAVAAIAGDLTDEKFCQHVAKEAIDTYGRVDVLINNAGILIPERLGQTKLENWNKVLRLNLTAPFVLTNELVPVMSERAVWPLIINVSSMSGVVGTPFCASYVASKYGLVGLTDAINEEFRIHGRIRSIALCPGTVDTPGMHKVNTPGISPKPEDAVLDVHHVAYVAVFFAKLRDHVNIDRIVFKKRKADQTA
jgi:NAD(P)-dependent dehydrogenase (short-subunit alcohol dehydrogenase family)